MSEKIMTGNNEEQRQEELTDAELTDLAGGTDSRSSSVEEIKSDTGRSSMEGGAGFDFVQVNGSNTAGDNF